MPGAVTTIVDASKPLTDHPLNKNRLMWCRGVRNSGWTGGKTLRDLCRRQDMVFVGAPKWGEASTFGGDGNPLIDRPVSYPGTDTDYANVASPVSTVLPTAALSVGIYLRTQSATNGVAVECGKAGTDFWQLYIPGAVRFGLNGTTVTGSITVNDAKWHYILMTWDGATIRGYVDGVFDTSAAKSGAITYTTPQISIASDEPASSGFALACVADSFSLWGRELQAGEAAALYQEEKRGCPYTLNWLDSPYPAVFGAQAATPQIGNWANFDSSIYEPTRILAY